jgi:hypothetical protein
MQHKMLLGKMSYDYLERHYRNRALCRAPTAHGKGTKTHGTAFAVRLFPKRTAKGARLIFTR